MNVLPQESVVLLVSMHSYVHIKASNLAVGIRMSVISKMINTNVFVYYIFLVFLPLIHVHFVVNIQIRDTIILFLPY